MAGQLVQPPEDTLTSYWRPSSGVSLARPQVWLQRIKPPNTPAMSANTKATDQRKAFRVSRSYASWSAKPAGTAATIPTSIAPSLRRVHGRTRPTTKPADIPLAKYAAITSHSCDPAISPRDPAMNIASTLNTAAKRAPFATPQRIFLESALFRGTPISTLAKAGVDKPHRSGN